MSNIMSNIMSVDSNTPCRVKFYQSGAIVVRVRHNEIDEIFYIPLRDHPGIHGSIITDFTPLIDVLGPQVIVHEGGSVELRTICKLLCESQGLEWKESERQPLPPISPVNFRVDMSNFLRHRLELNETECIVFHNTGQTNMAMKPCTVFSNNAVDMEATFIQTMVDSLKTEQVTATDSRILYVTDFSGICVNMELDFDMPYQDQIILSKGGKLIKTYQNNDYLKRKKSFEVFVKALTLFQMMCVINAFQKITAQRQHVYIVFELPK